MQESFQRGEFQEEAYWRQFGEDKMKQTIVILLKKNKRVEKVRRKYHQGSKSFKPHISLVYPFQDINQRDLYEHISNSIKSMRPFKLILSGLKRSAKEYYLYLLVDKGKDKVMSLYKNLNKSLLKDFKNKDMPRYIPHLSLGIFRNKKEIDTAINKLRKEKLKAEYVISEIHLITLNKNLTIKSTKKFKLK